MNRLPAAVSVRLATGAQGARGIPPHPIVAPCRVGNGSRVWFFGVVNRGSGGGLVRCSNGAVRQSVPAFRELSEGGVVLGGSRVFGRVSRGLGVGRASCADNAVRQPISIAVGT